MGNSVPKFAMADLHLTPGNVLLEVDLGDRMRAQSNMRGDGCFKQHNLIAARVVRVPRSSTTKLGVKPGDLVWVRGGRGFPVRVGGCKLFIFHANDLAIRMDSDDAADDEIELPSYTKM